MSTRRNGVSSVQKSKHVEGEGLHWVLIAGGALLSTLSIRFGYKLKETLDSKQHTDATIDLKGNGTSDGRRLQGCRMHSNICSFTEDIGGCFNFIPGTEGKVEAKQHQTNSQILSEPDDGLPLVTVPAPEFQKTNGIVWASSIDLRELPPRPFHQSNCSDSPCVSESGSDIFSKREVIQKLRQQLKRRDDMILEMHDQILELQNSLDAQISHSGYLQSQVDVANRNLFDSEREIQKLRKMIADRCVGHVSLVHETSPLPTSDSRNGFANGYLDDEDNNYEALRGESERIEALKKEVGELKEVIEGKEYLVQSYKEQKVELSIKIKELQQRLDSQLPNIL